MVYYTDDELIIMTTEELRSICISYQLPHAGRKHDLIYYIQCARDDSSDWNW